MQVETASVVQDLLTARNIICGEAGVGKSAGLDPAARQYILNVCQDVLGTVGEELENFVSDEDWNWLSGKLPKIMYEFNSSPLKYNMVRIRLMEVMKSITDSAEYECEQSLGVLPREPYRMHERPRAEQLARALMEPLMEQRATFFNTLASQETRETEAANCKRAVAMFLTRFYSEMERRIPELRENR